MTAKPTDDHDGVQEPDREQGDSSRGEKNLMQRRKFIQGAALGALGVTAGGALRPFEAIAAKADETLSAAAGDTAHPAEGSASAIRPTQQPKFDHLVVLMMENRSFDHMLGRLYSPENPAPYDRPPRGQHFDGVLPVMANPVEAAYDWLPRIVPVSRAQHHTVPPDDKVGHQFPDAQAQLGRSRAAGNRMDGFVNNRVFNLGAGNRPPLSMVAAPMENFGPTEYLANGDGPFATTHVLSSLARNFAVCDNWHSSLPGPTLVNRSFVHAGTSNNWVSNDHDWSKNLNTTIFNELGSGNWRIYNGDGTTECLTYIIHPVITWDPSQRNSIAQFCQDALQGNLAPYSFIEPEVIGYDNGAPPDDQHPPRDIRVGEQLIRMVYNAVRNGPLWPRTLMVVIYDEHGGFFDHRYPPAALPPDPNLPPGEDGFGFNLLGVRVPAVLISPLIPQGTVFHPSQAVDHTAVIKTLCNRFGLASLTDRDANAVDLATVLGDTLRDDADMPSLPQWPIPASEMGPTPLNDLQRELVIQAARKHNVTVPPLRDTSEAKEFLRQLKG